MNPYDFVPLDMRHPPERRKPLWHAMLTHQHGPKLYSGHLSVYIKTETPLFIMDSPSQQDASKRDPRALKTSMHDRDGYYIIPGSSIKGMLRTIVETLCNGCVPIFRIPKEYNRDPLPHDFAACTNNTKLCIACRIFGMMGRRSADQKSIDVFLGKVNISDASVDEDSLAFYDPIYTAVLDTPKPRHRAFYLDPEQRFLAGRKFYFHHDGAPLTEKRLLEIRNKPGEYRNQYIQPLESDTESFTRIDFTQLEADEFAALLLAVTLLPDMRHKMGYGKPLGLGSVQLAPTGLTLVDYSTRYSAFRSGRGMTTYNADEVADLIDEQWASLDPHIHTAITRFCSYPSIAHLQRIWQWPPDNSVEYCYPSQGWFKSHPTARIAETRNLLFGD